MMRCSKGKLFVPMKLGGFQGYCKLWLDGQMFYCNNNKLSSSWPYVNYLLLKPNVVMDLILSFNSKALILF